MNVYVFEKKFRLFDIISVLCTMFNLRFWYKNLFTSTIIYSQNYGLSPVNLLPYYFTIKVYKVKHL